MGCWTMNVRGSILREAFAGRILPVAFVELEAKVRTFYSFRGRSLGSRVDLTYVKITLPGKLLGDGTQQRSLPVTCLYLSPRG